MEPVLDIEFSRYAPGPYLLASGRLSLCGCCYNVLIIGLRFPFRLESSSSWLTQPFTAVKSVSRSVCAKFRHASVSPPPFFHLHITHSNSFPVSHVIDNPSRAASQKHRSINDNFPLSQIFKKWANSPQGVAIIPLIMPGFEIKDYSHWLAQSLLQPIVKIIPNFGQKKFPITYTLYPKSSTLMQLQVGAWSNNHADIFSAED